MLDGRTPQGGTLLDVGGGTGVGTDEAIRRAPSDAYARRIVLEPQRGMLERAARRQRGRSGPDLIRAEGSGLPFGDGTIDVLLSLGVLCCMTESTVAPAVSELWRVLRPGGYCVVGVPKRWSEVSDPLFRTKGFRPVAQLRPGRTLYQRPGAIAAR